MCKPKLSVRLMTYNHENFIAQAMEGIMMQKTNFPFEVLVGDDFSSDNNLEIIKKYESTERIKVKILDRKKGDDYWKKRKELGRVYNFIDTINNCFGEYIAFLDGDDYWVDELKLQKQVDFLEKNPDFSLCGHKVHQVDFKSNFKSIFPPSDFIPKNQVISLKENLTKNVFPSCSLVFRKTYLHDFFNEKLIHAPVFDHPTIVYHLLQGTGFIFDEIMGHYRIHDGGEWGKLDVLNKIESKIKIQLSLKSIVPDIYSPILDKNINDLKLSKSIAYLNNSNREKAIRTFNDINLATISKRKYILTFLRVHFPFIQNFRLF